MPPIDDYVEIRLTTSLATEKQSWRPGQKYRCSKAEAKAKLESGEAIECSPDEPDWIAPEGWAGPMGKTSSATAPFGQDRKASPPAAPAARRPMRQTTAA